MTKELDELNKQNKELQVSVTQLLHHRAASEQTASDLLRTVTELRAQVSMLQKERDDWRAGFEQQLKENSASIGTIRELKDRIKELETEKNSTFPKPVKKGSVSKK
jgi:chromosome segregation ATPase